MKLFSFLGVAFASLFALCSCSGDFAVIHDVAEPKMATLVHHDYRFMSNVEVPLSQEGQSLTWPNRLESNQYFEFGYTYYLWGLSLTWNVDTNTPDHFKIYWDKYVDPYSQGYLANSLASPISFSTMSPSTGYYYGYERSNLGMLGYVFDADYTTNLTLASTTFNQMTDSTPAHMQYYWTPSNSGPYRLYYDGDKLFDFIYPLVQSYVSDSNNAYDTGYRVGYSEGYGNENSGGYHDGYEAGYDAGLMVDNGPVNTLSGLYSLFMSFPIDLLNSLNGFVVWNTPILTILVTFLISGLLLWVIKRLIK